MLYEVDMTCDRQGGQGGGGGEGGGGKGVVRAADMEASHFTLALLVTPLLIGSQPGLLLLLGLHLQAPQLGLGLVLHPFHHHSQHKDWVAGGKGGPGGPPPQPAPKASWMYDRYSCRLHTCLVLGGVAGVS